MVGTKGRRGGIRSWFVEPYRQVRLGLMFLVVNFVFAAAIVAVFGYYVWEMYAAVQSYFKLTGAESSAALQKFVLPIVAGSTLIGLFVITTILVSVRYTHEIYGPLVSIHRYLDELLSGRTPIPIQLRESDQLKDLAIKLNSVAERLSTDQRAGPMKAVHRYMDELLDGKAPEPLKLRDTDPLNDLANKLSRLAQKMKNA